MARGKKVSRKRIAIGVVVLVFLVAVVASSGQDLNLADPFAGGLDFRDRELSYSLFSIQNLPELRQFVAGTDAEILNKKCFLKLHTSAELDSGSIIALDSDFQTFGALTPFDLLTAQGGEIFEFRDIELRMRCDSIDKVGGGQHEFEVKPRTGNPLFITVTGYNQQGQLVELKGIDLKPAFEIGGLAYSFNSQTDFIVNPTGSQLNQFGTIKFANEPTLLDPLKGTTGLFTTSERTISKPVRISATDLENAIESSTQLEPRTFTSEIQFHIAGAFDIVFPELRDAGVLVDRQIPVDQGLLVNKMDVQVTEFTSGGISLNPTDKTAITKLEPVDTDGDFVVDGSASTKNLRVHVTLDNYNRAVEGSVTGKLLDVVGAIPSIITTTGFGCGFPVGVNGVQSNFICNFNVPQNTRVGDYQIIIDTGGTDRISASKTFLIIRSGSPVGLDDGCPDKYVRSVLFVCVLFGTTGTGALPFTTCPTGQIKNEFGECFIPTGGSGGDPNMDLNPCPVAGEVRDAVGICRSTSGSGGDGTKSCFDCQMNVVRTVVVGDVCPLFTCPDGTTTGTAGIPNCSDKLPADIVDNQFTCNRVVGFLGGLLPLLVDCEGEGREANADRGEICAPAFIIGLFENLPALLIGGIILIIFIVIIGFIVKKSPAGRAVSVVRGALPSG